MIEPNPTARPFAQRAGMLFVGAIHKQDSPNFDSLVWFVDAVLPLIEAELKWETRLTIAGYVAPGIDMGRFEHHPRITLRGPVADLNPLYNAHRVFVAPTRYAAGAPYKVLEAASRGVPVVATEVLRGELDWSRGTGNPGGRRGRPRTVRGPYRGAVSRRDTVAVGSRRGAAPFAAGERPGGFCSGGCLGADTATRQERPLRRDPVPNLPLRIAIDSLLFSQFHKKNT